MSSLDLRARGDSPAWVRGARRAGGLVHEQDGLSFVAGPSSYPRVTVRMDDGVDGRV
jgi:hypothetical protein